MKNHIEHNVSKPRIEGISQTFQFQNVRNLIETEECSLNRPIANQFEENCLIGVYQLLKIMKRIFHSRKYNAVVRLLDGEEFSTEVTVR